VYGQVGDFGSTSQGVEVYKFARKMKMQTLLEFLDKKFKDEATPYEIFEIYNLYMEPRNQDGLDWTLKVVFVEQVGESIIKICN
jgi:hypothetical protein